MYTVAEVEMKMWREAAISRLARYGFFKKEVRFNLTNVQDVRSKKNSNTHMCNQSRDKLTLIKNTDMSKDMQEAAIEIACKALDKYQLEKDIASYIKKEFDYKYGGTWHCIAGQYFGVYVTHEAGHFIQFYIGHVTVLLFKSG